MTNKNIVIITGASKGIGASTAELFAENGYDVCINYKNNTHAANVIVERIQRKGGSCIAVQADISNEDEVCELFNIVDKKFGPVSALINNAGILKKK